MQKTGDAMKLLPAIQMLIALASLSLVLDVVGVLVAPGIQMGPAILLLGGRFLLDISVVVSFFLPRRAVWVALTALYTFAICWRVLILSQIGRAHV